MPQVSVYKKYKDFWIRDSKLEFKVNWYSIAQTGYGSMLYEHVANLNFPRATRP